MHQNGRNEIQDPVVKEYSRIASAYDRKWSFYIEATTRETVRRLCLQPADRLLDVGCGTGAILRRLSSSHPHTQLSGLDPVPEMLMIARDRLSPAVELREGRVEQLPFSSEQFDVVVSASMFHYIRDPVRALREMGRVLRPGGRIVITDWCDDYLACRICDRYLRLFNDAHFKAYGSRECALLLEQTGFVDVSIDRYKINWLWGLMTARAAKDAA